MTTAPVTRTTGSTISATTENTVDAYWAAALDQIKNANIPSGAGITSDKLADRYNVVAIPFDLVPATGDADFNTPANITLPTSEFTVFKRTWRWHTSKKAFLYYVEFYVGTITTSGIQIFTYLNSTLLGNAATTITASDTTSYLRNATHAANPLAALSDGDVLKVNIKENANPSVAMMVTGTMWIKVENGS